MFQPAPGKKRSGFEESFLLVLSWKCYVIISGNCTAEKDITAQLQKQVELVVLYRRDFGVNKEYK